MHRKVTQYNLGKCGSKITVEYSKKKIYMFSYEKGEIIFSAPIVEKGKETDFWCNFIEPISDYTLTPKVKMRAFGMGSAVLVEYARLCNMHGAFDVDYEKLYDFVEANQSLFFKKNGDFKKYASHAVKMMFK